MRFNLKPLERGDLEWVLKHRNDPIQYFSFNQPMPLSMAQHLSWYENEVLTKKTFPFIITLNSVKMGYVALQNINWITRSAEVSHFILSEFDPYFRLMAHCGILSIAFNYLNLNRVHTICFCFNEFYKKLEEMGFQREGTARDIGFKEGKYTDGYYLAITKKDYEEKVGEWGKST